MGNPAGAAQGVLRVAINGVDSAGKTHFADEQALVLERTVPVVRASVDDRYRPMARRYERGRDSPGGFYRNSYDCDLLWRLLLGPLGPGGDGQDTAVTFDVAADQPLDLPVQQASPRGVLLFDGLFLRRPELRQCWEAPIFLRVPFGVSIPRGASRGEGYGSPDAAAASNSTSPRPS